MHRFHSRDPNEELHALVVVQKLKEGYDFNLISVVAMLDPMGESGLGNFTQFLGRLLRIIPEGNSEDNQGKKSSSLIHAHNLICTPTHTRTLPEIWIIQTTPNGERAEVVTKSECFPMHAIA